MGKPKSKKPKTKKKSKIVKEIKEPIELVQAPHSFIIHRGLSCPYIQDLTLDFRRLMEPFTASNLKEKKANRIKDFVSLSGVFSVSHMGIFNKRATQLSFKIIRMPRGPTLTFKVHEFTLARDVLTVHKKQYVNEEMFQHSPLVILNNFTGEGKHIKLMANSFQNMFPSINVAEVNVGTMKRCVLFSYNPVTKLVEMRHYSIQIVPVGLHKGVKKIVQGTIPNLSKCTDISDYFLNGGGASDSEMEEDDETTTVRDVNPKIECENNKSSIKLHEIGPRLTLELVKIEEGLLTGEVLFHSTVSKTSEEIEAIRAKVEKKKKLKEHAKKVQKENQERNKKKDESKKKKGYVPNERDEDMEEDHDAEYYREEVGEEPDEEIFRTKETYKARKKKQTKPAAK